ncbi:MAG: PIN domain-containing protein [Nanoarchaeota archaeon]
MITKYYLDSSIWRDLHEDRKDKFRPLGEWAFELLKKIRKNKDKVLYSDLVVDELMKAFNENVIKELFSIMSNGGLLEKVNVEKKHVKEAVELKHKYNIPFGDALHAVLARDNNAILVARDHHFEEIQHIIKAKKPEELI